MPEVTMVMPTMGESVIEATVIRWLKQEGDLIAEEESVLEVATDKVDSEVPTLYAGRLRRMLVQEGDVVKVGAPIAIITTEEKKIEREQVAVPSSTLPVAPVVFPPAGPVRSVSAPSAFSGTGRLHNGRFYSPLVRHIAQQTGVTSNELGQVPGTGQDNRVTKHDLLAYLQHRSQPMGYASSKIPEMRVPIGPDDEVIPLDRLRRATAERMVASKHTIPHVTSFVEADVTDLVQWRQQHKVVFERETRAKLTYTPLLIQAIARALRDFPMVNAWMVGDRVIKKKNINIGLAVALPDDNLIVPVIKNVDQLDLVELVHQAHALAHKARYGQLVPDDLAGGTYTVSNLGSFQNLMGTPIIVQPQVAIMALGAILKKPAVVQDAQGKDAIAIRHMMYLSHSYDHRVVDGVLGGGFVRCVARYLETCSDWLRWGEAVSE